MVIIHTAEDFIKAMDENPEWLEAVRSRVLPREVLELPRRFEELRAVVEQLAATQNQMLATQNQMLATQNQMLAEQAEMKATQAEMLATQNQMLATQTQILAEQAEMKAEQAEMKAEQAEMKGTQTQILAEQAEMKATQNAILAELKQHTDVLAELKGDKVERDLGKEIYGLLGGYPFRMRLVKVVRGYYWTNSMDRFNNDIHAASDDGEISNEQYDRIMKTDLIASARRRGADEDVYFVFEASGKINRNDVDRAIQSRDAIQAAFKDSEAQAWVYGREISEEDRRYAESVGAAVFISDAER